MPCDRTARASDEKLLTGARLAAVRRILPSPSAPVCFHWRECGWRVDPFYPWQRVLRYGQSPSLGLGD